MDPLISALLVIGWGLFSLWVGWRAMRRARATWMKLVALPVVAVVTLFAPFADEIIGAIQFERYCAAANHVPIYATIPVGDELYFPDGRWRLDSARAAAEIKERNRLMRSIEKHLRYEGIGPKRVPAAIPIAEHATRYVDRTSGRLLAEYRFYSTRGGWVSRHMVEAPSFVRAQCFPDEFGRITQSVLVFGMVAKGGGK